MDCVTSEWCYANVEGVRGEFVYGGCRDLCKDGELEDRHCSMHKCTFVSVFYSEGRSCFNLV